MSININAIVNFATAVNETEKYLPAEDKIITGAPHQEVTNHYASPCDQMNSGIWQGEVGHWRVNYSEHEYCEILEGCSVITDNNGSSMTVSKGDRFVIPAGFSGSWQVIEPCKKIYVVFESK